MKKIKEQRPAWQVRHPQRKALKLKEVAKKLLDETTEIIIRNLSYKLSEAEVKMITEPLAPQDVRLGKKDGKFAGFAFCTFSSREDAEKAIKTLKGKNVLGRKLVADLAVGKFEYQSIEKKLEEMEEHEAEGSSSATPEKIKTEQQEAESRKRKSSVPDEETEVKVESENEQESEAVKTEAAPKMQAKKRRKTDVDEGRSLFVWNIPFDATPAEVMEQLKPYGTVLNVKFNKKNGEEFVGTSFVEFKEPKSVTDLVALDEAAEKSAISEKASHAAAKKKGVMDDLKTLPIDGVTVSIRGRRLRFSKAMNKDEAKLKKENADRFRELIGMGKEAKIPSKNFSFLVEHGIIDPVGPDGSQDDQDRWGAMKKRLADPNYFLNPLRLSVQRVPETMGQSGLKLALAKMLISKNEARMALIKNAKLIEQLRKKKWNPAREVRKAQDANEILTDTYVFKKADEDVKKSGFKKLKPDAMMRLAKDALRNVNIIEEKDPVKKLKKKNKGFGFAEVACHSLAKHLKDISLTKSKLRLEFVLENANAIHKQDQKRLPKSKIPSE